MADPIYPPLSGTVFLALAALSAVLVSAMARLGVPDHPDARKAHDKPVAKSGGVGIVAACLLAAVWGWHAGGAATPLPGELAGLCAGGALVASVGLLDDLFDWPFGVKLAAQIAAAALLVAHWHDPLAVAAGMAVALVVTNAVNFIDGLNGLASGVCLVAAVALCAGTGWRATPAALPAFGLAAGIVGFLPFNFPRARIFMSDVGSQFCGFVLAASMLGAGDGGRSRWIVALALSGVLVDVGLTLARRMAAGENITRPHRSHLYQIAHRAGMPAWTIAALHWGFAVWGVGLAMSRLPATRSVGLALAPQAIWIAIVICLWRRAVTKPPRAIRSV